MLKAVIASFIGTFLALAAIGGVAAIALDRTIDRIAGEISTRVTAVREQAATAVARVRERAVGDRTALAAALEAGRGKRELLVAFGECVAAHADSGDRPAGAVERCLQDYAWVEP